MDIFNIVALPIIGLALVGALIGWWILRPFLKRLSRYLRDRNLDELGELCMRLSRSSLLTFSLLALNFYRFIPLEGDSHTGLVKSVHLINIAVFTYLIGELIIYLSDRYFRSKINKVSTLVHVLIRMLIYAAGTIVFANEAGIHIAPVLTALGVGGLAVALALQDTLGNLFAGIQILAAKQLKPHDYIKLDSGDEGYVIDINWRNTEIKTLLGNVVIVPNSKISSSITTNYFSEHEKMYFQTVVGVHYDTDLELAQRLTEQTVKELLKDNPAFSADLQPRVRFFEFAESSINIRVWIPCDTYEHRYFMEHEFIKRLRKRFSEHDIVIPFPIRTLYVSDELSKDIRQGRGLAGIE